MANQQANVYAFTVYQKSQEFYTGTSYPQPGVSQMGTQVYVFSQTPALALALVQGQFGADVANIQGPTQLLAGVWTSLTGGPFTLEEPPNPPNRFLPPEAEQHSKEKDHKAAVHGRR